MILLHGLFGGLSNWNEIIDHFKDHFNIYVPELPIYEDHKGDSLQYLLASLESSIDKAGLQNVILVGNSLGGHIALRYTLKHPRNVSKLILTGSSGLYENTQFGSYLKRNNYAYIKDRVAATFYDPALGTEELVNEVLKVTANPLKCLSAVKTAKATKRDNLLTRLPGISVPVLLIWGENDQITPPSVAYEFRDHLPNVKLVMIAECGHAPMMEHPKLFNVALSEFLADTI